MKAKTLNDIENLANRLLASAATCRESLIAEKVYKTYALNPERSPNPSEAAVKEYQNLYDRCVQDRLDMEKIMAQDAEVLARLLNSLN